LALICCRQQHHLNNPSSESTPRTWFVTPVALQAADYVPGSGIRLDNPFKHGVSAGLLLLDLALSRVPLISYHIQVRLTAAAGQQMLQVLVKS
jgi:hypothetical protein